MTNKIKEYSKKINYDLWVDAYSPPPVYEAVNQKETEKEKFDPDIHGGGVESFGTYTPPPPPNKVKWNLESEG